MSSEEGKVRKNARPGCRDWNSISVLVLANAALAFPTHDTVSSSVALCRLTVVYQDGFLVRIVRQNFCFTHVYLQADGAGYIISVAFESEYERAKLCHHRIPSLPVSCRGST